MRNLILLLILTLSMVPVASAITVNGAETIFLIQETQSIPYTFINNDNTTVFIETILTSSILETEMQPKSFTLEPGQSRQAVLNIHKADKLNGEEEVISFAVRTQNEILLKKILVKIKDPIVIDNDNEEEEENPDQNGFDTNFFSAGFAILSDSVAGLDLFEVLIFIVIIILVVFMIKQIRRRSGK